MRKRNAIALFAVLLGGFRFPEAGSAVDAVPAEARVVDIASIHERFASLRAADPADADLKAVEAAAVEVAESLNAFFKANAGKTLEDLARDGKIAHYTPPAKVTRQAKYDLPLKFQNTALSILEGFDKEGDLSYMSVEAGARLNLSFSGGRFQAAALQLPGDRSRAVVCKDGSLLFNKSSKNILRTYAEFGPFKWPEALEAFLAKNLESKTPEIAGIAKQLSEARALADTLKSGLDYTFFDASDKESYGQAPPNEKIESHWMARCSLARNPHFSIQFSPEDKTLRKLDAFWLVAHHRERLLAEFDPLTITQEYGSGMVRKLVCGADGTIKDMKTDSEAIERIAQHEDEQSGATTRPGWTPRPKVRIPADQVRKLNLDKAREQLAAIKSKQDLSRVVSALEIAAGVFNRDDNSSATLLRLGSIQALPPASTKGLGAPQYELTRKIEAKSVKVCEYEVGGELAEMRLIVEGEFEARYASGFLGSLTLSLPEGKSLYASWGKDGRYQSEQLFAPPVPPKQTTYKEIGGYSSPPIPERLSPGKSTSAEEMRRSEEILARTRKYIETVEANKEGMSYWQHPKEFVGQFQMGKSGLIYIFVSSRTKAVTNMSVSDRAYPSLSRLNVTWTAEDLRIKVEGNNGQARLVLQCDQAGKVTKFEDRSRTGSTP